MAFYVRLADLELRLARFLKRKGYADDEAIKRALGLKRWQQLENLRTRPDSRIRM